MMDLLSSGTRTATYLFAKEVDTLLYFLSVTLYVALVLIGLSLVRYCLSQWLVWVWGSAMHEVDPSLNQPLLNEEGEYDYANYSHVLGPTYNEEPGFRPWVCGVCAFDNRPDVIYCDICHTPKSPLLLAVDFKGEDTATEEELNSTQEIKCNLSGNTALPGVAVPTSSQGLATDGSFDLESMEQGSSSSGVVFKAPLEAKSVIRRQLVPLHRFTRKQKLAVRRHRWQRRVQQSELPLVPPSDGSTFVWGRYEMSRREGGKISSLSEVVVPRSPGFIAVWSENEGMDWSETSAVDGLFFGTSYADTTSQNRRKQLQVMMHRMCGSSRVFSAGTSLPRWAAPEDSTEGGQINDTVSINGEAEGGEGACFESPRTDEGYISEGSGSYFPFWAKTIWLLDQLAILQYPHGAGREAMHIEIRRGHLLQDSFIQIMSFKATHLRRWLRIYFKDEPGVDAGGLEREWFQLVLHALFDPSAGLFLSSAEDSSFNINPGSGIANDLHLEYFRFTGRMLGKLILGRAVTPYRLSFPLLQHILGAPLSFSDLAFIDSELYKNLKLLQNQQGDVESMGLDFTVIVECFDVKNVVELKPGGRDLAVNSENVDEYLKLRFQHLVLSSVEDQLELLLNGLDELDVHEWRRWTVYHGEFSGQGDGHRVIRWFWETVEDMNPGERANLLQFCTGASRLPPLGFKSLTSNNGYYCQFSIHSIEQSDSFLPRSHSCFNRLDMPLYSSKEVLQDRLRLAISHGHIGFDIE